MSAFANKVDDLQTDSDVVNFFIRTFDKSFISDYTPKLFISSSEELIKRNSCDSLAVTWNIKNWEKVDFNNDNKTDLLAIVNWYHTDCSYVAIDKGNNTFQLIQIGGSSWQNCQLASTIKYAGQQMVLLHTWAITHAGRKDGKWFSRTDTLIYKFNDFVEFNKEPTRYKIDSITYSYLSGWYGNFTTPQENYKPDRIVKIDHSGNVILTNTKNFGIILLAKGEKEPHNPQLTAGVFKTKLKNADLKEIYDLIDYLSIKKLNQTYAVQHTYDLTSNFIRIKFTDGSVKYIADYGGVGTFGLRNLFSKLYPLPQTQHWE